MRFLHPVLNGYLSGQAIGDNDADTTLLALPDWDGKTLSLRYFAARGDAAAVADIMLKQSDIPLHTLLLPLHAGRGMPQRSNVARQSVCQFVNHPSIGRTT